MSNKIKSTILLILFVSLVTIIYSNKNTAKATTYCVTEKCKAAEAKEAELKTKANEASAAAATYQEEVNRLTQEINAIQAEINSLNLQIEDLNGQIVLAQAKLEKQQKALAKLIIDIHFNTKSEPILILAGSNSVSDIAEKETRNQTVEEQVTKAATEVKKTKEELEIKKEAVDDMKKAASSKQQDIILARTRQQQLVTKYKSDASSYLADSETARKEKDAEIEAYRQEMLRNLGNNTVVVDPGLDSYAPALKSSTGYTCPKDNWRYYATNGHHGYTSWHGGYLCECVSYAGYKAYEYWGINVGWGDAKYWGSGARAAGYRVDSTPEAHSIGYLTSGSWGHVVWIENVNPNGTIDYSEYNGNIKANFSFVKGASASKFHYIHFN